MNEIIFISFNRVNPNDLLAVVNENSLRTHLIDHPYFDATSIQEWINDKIKIDEMTGCRVRAVLINGVVAGWCGIQPDSNGFELAIVIAQRYWGYGIAIFRILMSWAKELGHKEVLFHLLDSRPEYRVLSKMSTKVYKTELAGRRFTTYHVLVGI